MDTTRQRILEAAGSEFAELGFERARVRSIVARADANVAAVNYHFGDKERLYEEAVLHAHVCAKGESHDDPSRAPEWRLRAYVADFIREMVAPGPEVADDWHRRLLMREMMNPGRGLDRVVAEGIGPRFRLLRAILRDLCPDADERRITALAFSVVGQCLHYRMACPVIERLIGPELIRQLDVHYVAGHIADFTLAAIGRGDPGWMSRRDEGGRES